MEKLGGLRYVLSNTESVHGERQMSAHQNAIWVATFPFKAVWFLILIADVLVVTAAYVQFAASVACGAKRRASTTI